MVTGTFGKEVTKSWRSCWKGMGRMREIKFRAWTHGWHGKGPSSKMIYSGNLSEPTDHLDFYTLRVGDTLMQYTGFKDENGIEIFENDIVHTVGVIPGVEIDDIGIVKFIDGSWIVENLDGDDGWYLFQEGTDVEVLGNVFENPELLKGAEE